MNEMTAEMLKQFISTFSASLDPRVWATFIKEEKEELYEALEKEDKENILKEATDLLYVTVGFNLVAAGAEKFGLFPEDEYEEMIELLTSGTVAHEKAIEYLGEDKNYFEAFRRVHESNMTKLDDEGKPIRREDGKILKGPNYKPPTMEGLV